MTETNRMPSIARRINMHFWLKQLSTLILIDVVLIGVLALAFFSWRESAVPDGQSIANRYFAGEWDYLTWRYVIETEAGKAYSVYISKILIYFKTPAIIFGVAQLIVLICELFNTKHVRAMLKPLNEIAVAAEELSKNGFDSSKVENIEHAIESVNPSVPGSKVKTGDKDLLSIEIAINNLLERMRETQQQQQRFVSDASHELRTPIAVIQGYVNMLDRWGKEDEHVLEESIEALKNESEQMKNLVEQLLFLARGDSGKNALKKENFDLSQTVIDVLEESSMIDKEHKYRFAGEKNIMAHGDVSMIKQSVRILVQNAAKYSQGGNEIVLGTRNTENGPVYLVQDEGIGMKSDDLIHVFERFYRSDSARNTAEGGTGLGLSICKWIVDAHNGTIQVLSRPEFGTRFTVNLPKEDAKEENNQEKD